MWIICLSADTTNTQSLIMSYLYTPSYFEIDKDITFTAMTTIFLLMPKNQMHYFKYRELKLKCQTSECMKQWKGEPSIQNIKQWNKYSPCLMWRMKNINFIWRKIHLLIIFWHEPLKHTCLRTQIKYSSAVAML